MAPEQLQSLEPDEGLVVGSVRIEGGDDILGRTRWELVARKATSSLSFGREYAVEAERGGEEQVFVAKMPAGSYTFFAIVQPGFSTFEATIDVPFDVQAGETVYVGRLTVGFPPGKITAFTPIRLEVEYAMADTIAAAEAQYGISLSGAFPRLMRVR